MRERMTRRHLPQNYASFQSGMISSRVSLSQPIRRVKVLRGKRLEIAKVITVFQYSLRMIWRLNKTFLIGSVADKQSLCREQKEMTSEASLVHFGHFVHEEQD
jgi:hypothetical protein